MGSETEFNSCGCGALVTVKKGAKQYLEQILCFPNLTEIQKNVLTITAHIVRKAQSI